jgi:hypothetical protein
MAEEMLSAGLLPEVLAELEQAAAVDLNDPDYDPWEYLSVCRTRAVREQVARAATSALDNAYWELIDRPALDAETREHLQDLLNAQRLLSRISKRNLSTIAFHLAQFKGVPEYTPLATAHLQGIHSAAQQYHEWMSRLLSNFPYTSTPNTNRNVLSWHFINEMASRYEKLTGTKPSVSKSGPFVRLLAAAWLDVDFPQPEDREGRAREDLEGWLGDLVEKHPAVHRKSRRR